MKYHVSIIIPAAGLSQRHPPNKLLIPLKNKPVIVETVSRFIEFPVNIIVVVGYAKNKLIPVLESALGDHINIIENPDYRQGLSSSIKAGIRAAGVVTDYYGFCVGDKPFLHLTTVGMLLETLNRKSPDILVPIYKGTIGHPNFFSKKYRKDLLELSGDTGGRTLFQTYQTKTYFLPVKDKGVILDMDQFLADTDGIKPS